MQIAAYRHYCWWRFFYGLEIANLTLVLLVACFSFGLEITNLMLICFGGLIFGGDWKSQIATYTRYCWWLLFFLLVEIANLILVIFWGGIGNRKSLRTRVIVDAFFLLVEIANLMLVIVVVFFIGNRESLYSRVIVGGFSFFKMVNANLMLVIVGGFTFLGGNYKSLNTLMLIAYVFLMKIANLMLLIVGGVSCFLMEITNCYRRYCFV